MALTCCPDKPQALASGSAIYFQEAQTRLGASTGKQWKNSGSSAVKEKPQHNTGTLYEGSQE